MKELKENIARHIEILCERYPTLESVKKEIVEAYFLLEESYKNGGKLLVAGNGGSAADAEHIVGELMKGFKLPRKPDADFADSFVSLIVCSGLLIINQKLAAFLYKGDYFVAWKSVPFLLFGTVFSGISQFEGSLFAAMKKTKDVAKTTIVGAGVNTLCNFIFVYYPIFVMLYLYYKY